jgi:hypothetical protein
MSGATLNLIAQFSITDIEKTSIDLLSYHRQLLPAGSAIDQDCEFALRG